jgi:hypothetical protein
MRTVSAVRNIHGSRHIGTVHKGPGCTRYGKKMAEEVYIDLVQNLSVF